jgi:phosphoglycolate phosphatase-like HAD superfamily hydrolase
MHAYIFDIDGTLARSNDLDERLFARAIEEVLGVQGISTDWASYAETTDEAITRELIQMHRASDDAERLVASTRSRFIDMVRADLSDLQRTITPVPGVPSVLDLLAEREGASVAMATGGWPESAKLKLETVGVDYSRHRLSTCADHPHRYAIIRHALAGLGRDTDGAVYFGDGIWDARASKRLGIGFVGIAAEPGKRERLEAEGVTVILNDFSDIDEVVDATERALSIASA